MPYNVVVSDTRMVDGETRAAVLDEIDATVETTAAKEPAAVARAVKGVNALVVDTGTQVAAEVVDATDSLQVVGRAGIGVDNVDVRAAVEAGVTVVNVPDYSVEEVSTHAFALVLACLRKIPTFDRSVKRGEWEWSVGQPVRRLAGSTVGLVDETALYDALVSGDFDEAGLDFARRNRPETRRCTTSAASSVAPRSRGTPRSPGSN